MRGTLRGPMFLLIATGNTAIAVAQEIQHIVSDSCSQEIYFSLTSNNQCVSRLIGNKGGKIELPGIAAVSFPSGAFESPQSVLLRITTDNGVNELFNDTAAIFRRLNRVPYEIRIGTGDSPPRSDTVSVEMKVPEELFESVASGFTIEVLVGIEQGGALELPHTVFEIMDSKYIHDERVVRCEIPAAAFANNPLTQGEYQAIIIVALVP